MSVCWSWIDQHGRENPYESAVSATIESASAAGLKSVDIDAKRFVDLVAMTQVNRSTKKTRAIVRTLLSSASAVDDATCFADDVFHFALEPRDRELEALVTSHGAKLARHVHAKVTRIVRAFNDESDPRVVTPADVRAAVDSAEFAPLLLSPPKKRAVAAVAASASSSAASASTAAAAPAKRAKVGGAGSLDPAVADLVSWIGSLDDLNEALKQFELDIDRIGRLAPSTIGRGFSLLSEAAAILARKYDRAALEKISSDFYSSIPHATGSKRPPLIDSLSMVEAKTALLRNLQHMSFASKLHGGDTEVGPETLLAALHVTLSPLVVMTSPTATRDYERVEEYLTSTCHASHPRITLETVFSVHRHSEAPFAAAAAPGGEREIMAWHGTRKQNLLSILRHGMQVAPPEAPTTGAMFGRGIYASCCASKSAQYCRVDPKKGGKSSATRGVLLLLAVRVGATERRQHASAAAPRAPHDSVHGVGVLSNATATLDERGIEWPGALKESGLTKGLLDDSTALEFDEFVVYDAARVRIAFLCVVRFHAEKEKAKAKK
jgi:hypothetical protein